jgi:hypothetical protein
VKAFDSTLQTTHVWLNEICEELGWDRAPRRAYRALRMVLHAPSCAKTVSSVKWLCQRMTRGESGQSMSEK